MVDIVPIVKLLRQYYHLMDILR